MTVTDLSPFPVVLVPIVLASGSPRRSELLTAARIPHVVRPSDIDESILPGENAIEYVRRIAREKNLARIGDAAEVVIAADTTVVVDGQILLKPSDEEDARRMLRLLSGSAHQVITGVCIRRGGAIWVGHDVTTVTFAAITDDEITELIASGEPMDKAGAYAIQGIASRYVERIEGSYSNVVGLPVAMVWRELRNFLS
jgi:septum formation protein